MKEASTRQCCRNGMLLLRKTPRSKSRQDREWTSPERAMQRPNNRALWGSGSCSANYSRAVDGSTWRATTIPVDAPSRAETRQAFDEVSSALHSVSYHHEEVKAGMQTLASGVEDLHRARLGDVRLQPKSKRRCSEPYLRLEISKCALGQAEAKSSSSTSSS